MEKLPEIKEGDFITIFKAAPKKRGEATKVKEHNVKVLQIKDDKIQVAFKQKNPRSLEVLWIALDTVKKVVGEGLKIWEDLKEFFEHLPYIITEDSLDLHYTERPQKGDHLDMVSYEYYRRTEKKGNVQLNDHEIVFLTEGKTLV